MISTSPIKISCVVRGDEVAQAVRALHRAFELGAEEVRAEHPFGQVAATTAAAPGARGAAS
jgi:aspartate kinase